MIKAIAEHFGAITTIVGGLCLLIPKVRYFFGMLLRGFWIMLRAPWLLIEIEKDVKFLKSQVVRNGGGSLKDSNLRLEYAAERQESFRRHDFWTKGRPSMEMDSHAHVSLVSEAACHLFGVANPEALFRLSWAQYIDQQDVAEFLDALIQAIQGESGFRRAINLYSRDRVDLGEWEFRAGPIKGAIPGEKSFSGHWVPVDDRSLEIASEYQWAK
jgi:hypothetical protein